MPPLQLHLGSTFGVAYVGILLAAMYVRLHFDQGEAHCAAFRVYGVTCIQTFLYFQSVNKDHVILKALVCNLKPLPPAGQR